MKFSGLRRLAVRATRLSTHRDTVKVLKKTDAQTAAEDSIMDKVMVNGPDTSPVYRYLKDVTDSGDLTWNFGAYFLIGTDGTITRHESRG